MLSKSIFNTIIENTPLVAIDLIIKNQSGNILLGRRVNEPAKNYLFVPGGRIYKNETFATAFERITYNELGTKFLLSNANYHGHYEHFYDKSVDNENISTHYIVLAYELFVTNLASLPFRQHKEYFWVSIHDIIKNGEVHKYTQNYFKGEDVND